MKVIALVVVLTWVVGSSECATKCHWGPSYWCKNITTAEECGGIQYCMDNVWKSKDASNKFVQKLKKTEVRGVACDTCEAVMAQIGGIWTSNTTQQLIQAYFNIACGMLPCQLGTACTGAVEQLLPMINDLISSGLLGKTVCAAAYLCPPSDETCALCTGVFEGIKPVITNLVTQAGEMIGKVCTILPDPIGPQCTATVATVVAKVIELVDKVINPQVLCTLGHQCARSTSGLLL